MMVQLLPVFSVLRNFYQPLLCNMLSHLFVQVTVPFVLVNFLLQKFAIRPIFINFLLINFISLFILYYIYICNGPVNALIALPTLG